MRRGLAVVCACFALSQVQAGNLADARVTGLSFASITAQDAFARIGAQAGVVIAIHDDVHALITAQEVSGRLPVVLDNLSRSLGLTWEEKDGVVVIRRKGAEKKPVAIVGGTPATPVVSVPAAPAVVAQAKQSETAPVPPQPAAVLPAKPVEPPVTATPADKSATAAPKAEEPAKAIEQTSPAITLKLTGADLPAYALRDFLRSHGMALVWGAGDVGSVAPVARVYTGDTPLAVADAVLRAHGLHGIYARSDKTLYVR